MADLDIYLLGVPRIERFGTPVELDTRKAVALVAYLALSGERQPRDSLAAFLWPELDDSRARAALRRTLSTLKAATDEACLLISRDSIGLQPEKIWCDSREFEQLLNSPPTARQQEKAVNLYRDHFLTGFSLRDSLPFDEWQLLQTQKLKRLLETALENLVQTYSSQAAFEQALPLAQRWLEQDPLREEAHRVLMRLYAEMGRRNAALRQYRDCVRILEEELGVAPLEETTALYQIIQAGEWTNTFSVERKSGRTNDRSAPLEQPGTGVEGHLPVWPLVGRAAELAQMQAVFEQVGPDGRLLALTGEAGIGKTRLAEAFLSANQDIPLLSARCYAGETNLAYGPFSQAIRAALDQPELRQQFSSTPAHWLAEAARLIPELAAILPGLPDLAPLEGPGGQSRFFEAMAQLLLGLCTGEGKGIFWLDDAHWADTASLDLLTYLVRRLQQRPLLVLVTWRDEELPTGHRLPQLLAETRRAGSGVLVSLNRLNQADVAQLLQTWRPTSSSSAVRRLYQETEGLPYFVIEYLAAFSGPDGESELEETTANDWPMPGTVRDLLQNRLNLVSQTGQQLLQTAAAVGRTFDAELLRLASGRSEEETVTVLEELSGRGLLVERKIEPKEGGPPKEDGSPMVSASLTGRRPVFDFSHNKLRDLVYDETSLVRRRLLHRRVAEVLAAEARRKPQPAALAGQIAGHYQLAGREQEAAAAFQQAGDYARSLYANQEALAHYQAALALGNPETTALHEACGDLQTLLGNYRQALNSYETAAAQAGQQDLGRLEHKLGQVYRRQGEWQAARQQLKRALASYGPDAPPDALAALYIDWSFVAYRQGEQEQALEQAEQALSLAQKCTNSVIMAQTHNILGILARRRGDLAEAVQQLEQSRQLAEASGQLEAQVAALNNLALTEHAAGRPEQALLLLKTAVQLCVTYGDRHREAALYNNLADLLNTLGQDEEAMVHLKQSVTIYAELGRVQGEWQPEIWKMTEW